MRPDCSESAFRLPAKRGSVSPWGYRQSPSERIERMRTNVAKGVAQMTRMCTADPRAHYAEVFGEPKCRLTCTRVGAHQRTLPTHGPGHAPPSARQQRDSRG